MSTGILHWLATQYPDAQFTIAAGKASAPVFESFPQLERLLLIQKRPYHLHWFGVWKACIGTHWDIIVDLRCSLISYVLRARRRFVFRAPNAGLSKAEQLAAIFSLSPPPPTRLWPSAEARIQASKHLPERGAFILLAPKSNAAAKDWPIERFAELAQRLNGSDYVFVVMASQAQQDDVHPLVKALPKEKVIDLSGKTDLPTAMAVIERAQLFIGNDSGLLHMAAALGKKCIGLYGPTNDKIYAPRGAHVHIITSHNFAPDEAEKRDLNYMLKISVAEVEDAARAMLAKP